MGHWRFITNHARTLLCIAHDPGVRLRDIAAMVGVTERSAHDMVSDLVDAGYVIKDKDGRRNQYRIQEHVPLRDPISQEPTIGEMLNLLVGVNAHRNPYKPRHDPRWLTSHPANPAARNPGKLKERRTANTLTRKRRSGSAPFETTDQHRQ